MVFPYGAQRENLVGCPRWSQDSASSAADVFAMIGSPPVFRLRSVLVYIFFYKYYVMSEYQGFDFAFEGMVGFKLRSELQWHLSRG